MKINFALELIVFEVYGQTSVPFFSWHFITIFKWNNKHKTLLCYENIKKIEKIKKNEWKKFVDQGGFEPTTLGFEGEGCTTELKFHLQNLS